MNYRSKTTSMVICLFFGLIGAHWFYLGRWRWGLIYAAATLLAWPAGWLLMFLFTSLGLIGIGLYWLWLAWFITAILGCAVLYDLFCLLAIHPREFDHQFNR